MVALQVIQPGLYGMDLAARAKLGENQMENIGTKAAVFVAPGEGLTSPGMWLE